jgi:XTP/dITP diphosphohydrolase
MKIILATNNEGKIREFRKLVEDNSSLVFVTPEEMGLKSFVPVENGDSFEENAYIKAKAFFSRTKLPAIADDSGLIVKGLGGEPGIHSARYAGKDADDKANIAKLLGELKDKKNRSAYFETVICYYDGVGIEYAEGRIDGKISEEPRGEGGFGYDPVFIPEGYDKTFAEMGPEEKNRISHRAKAMEKIKLELLDKL